MLITARKDRMMVRKEIADIELMNLAVKNLLEPG